MQHTEQLWMRCSGGVACLPRTVRRSVIDQDHLPSGRIDRLGDKRVQAGLEVFSGIVDGYDNAYVQLFRVKQIFAHYQRLPFPST